MPPKLYKNIHADNSSIKIFLGIEKTTLLSRTSYDFIYDFTFDQVLCNIESKFVCTINNLCMLKSDSNILK